MASLQELRKRLRSIRSTEQLAGAMRTAATAKYARLNRVRSDFAPYAAACRDMLSVLGSEGIRVETESPADRDCLVILGGNRGMCGGFNAELLRFLEKELAEHGDPLLLAGGKKAAHWLRERGLAPEEFLLPDVPEYSDVKPLADRLRRAYTSGEVSRVLVVYQHFQNMLTQVPSVCRVLPEEASPRTGDAAGLLYLPDAASIGQQLSVSCLDAQVFGLVMENAAGAQAATLMAMRSACDNAEASAAQLETTINRRRQAEVTAGVIETASGNIQQ